MRTGMLSLPGDHGIVISVSRTGWDVQFYPGFETWVDSLEQSDTEALLVALRVRRDEGPALGRPLVDSVVGSRHANMKELRPGSTGRTEVRALFAFDRNRRWQSCLSGVTRVLTGAAGTAATSRSPMTGLASTKPCVRSVTR